MTAAHTPGPWTVQKDDLQGYPKVGAYHPRAAVNPHATGRIDLAIPAPHFDHDERMANANLIAAAPDLLEALDALVIESGGKTIPNDRLTAARDRALAAIAKARAA